MEEMYSHKMPLKGRKCYEAYQDRKSVCPWCPSVESLKTGDKRTAEVPYPDAKDPQGWIDLSSYPLKNSKGEVTGLIEYVKDITERKRVEAALQNMQKLESLGTLAGGIAHDFNNLLGGIFGYIDIAAEKTREKYIANNLAKALGTIDRARGLTQQLLTFAKGGVPIKKIEKLTPFVQETTNFALSGSRVSCSFNIPTNLWLSEYDKNQIAQVIDNIIINAQQAMPDGGTIEVNAENIPINDKTHATLSAGNYVKVSVTDHGIGMPKEILTRIFDPFFTTKTKGHGLGLATSYSIIKRHGGCIEVDSEPGKGSTFHFYLPAVPDGTYTATSITASQHKGSGTIIVMEGEEIIRDTFSNILKFLGYSVICTHNGREAIDFFKAEIKANREITAMILDLTIPGGMGGKEAIDEIRKIDQKIPVFVASGYADDPVIANPKEYGFTASICKPFRKVDLAELLNKHLSGKE